MFAPSLNRSNPECDGDGEIIGSVGVSGDTSDKDEAAGAAGIEAAGLVPGI